MPVTERSFFNLAVLRVPLATLARSFEQAAIPGVSLRHAELAFPNQTYSPQSDDPPMILWSPRSAPEFTAFMPQASSGDYFVVSHACTRFGNAGVTVRSTTQDVEWPINEFIFYEHNSRQRIVRAMRDSPRWEFFADGPQLPFEQVECYRARRIRDRFTRPVLLHYLQSWSVDVQEPDFWRTTEPPYTFARIERNDG